MPVLDKESRSSTVAPRGCTAHAVQVVGPAAAPEQPAEPAIGRPRHAAGKAWTLEHRLEQARRQEA
jgi:hypothetical protein